MSYWILTFGRWGRVVIFEQHSQLVQASFPQSLKNMEDMIIVLVKWSAKALCRTCGLFWHLVGHHWAKQTHLQSNVHLIQLKWLHFCLIYIVGITSSLTILELNSVSWTLFGFTPSLYSTIQHGTVILLRQLRKICFLYTVKFRYVIYVPGTLTVGQRQRCPWSDNFILFASFFPACMVDTSLWTAWSYHGHAFLNFKSC